MTNKLRKRNPNPQYREIRQDGDIVVEEIRVMSGSERTAGLPARPESGISFLAIQVKSSQKDESRGLASAAPEKPRQYARGHDSSSQHPRGTHASGETSDHHRIQQDASLIPIRSGQAPPQEEPRRGYSRHSSTRQTTSPSKPIYEYPNARHHTSSVPDSPRPPSMSSLSTTISAMPLLQPSPGATSRTMYFAQSSMTLDHVLQDSNPHFQSLSRHGPSAILPSSSFQRLERPPEAGSRFHEDMSVYNEYTSTV